MGGVISFEVADFLNNMPFENKRFTNIIWDESIDMFKEEEQRIILSNIRKRLDKYGGILTGSCVLKDGSDLWSHYVGQFEDFDCLHNFLSEFFNNVYIYPKLNILSNMCLFMCSNGKLPINI